MYKLYFEKKHVFLFLPIFMLVKSIFEQTNFWFVELGRMIKCVLWVWHQYS